MGKKFNLGDWRFSQYHTLPAIGNENSSQVVEHIELLKSTKHWQGMFFEVIFSLNLLGLLTPTQLVSIGTQQTSYQNAENV